MANQKQYEQAVVFNARIVDMRFLFEPSYEFEGKKSEKPSYYASFIVPKTQPQWHLEPQLAELAAACGRLYQAHPHITSWPVVDGDLPNPKTNEVSDSARGHWRFSANTNQSAPSVEIVQVGGNLAKLTGKIGVKSGDYVMAGVTAAVKQNDPRGVKLFLNAVVFSSPGEEIVFANSVSGAELMQQAQKQGLQVAGFAASPGGFAPQGGGSPGFTPPGQPQGQSATPFGQPSGPGGPSQTGTTTFPSSGAPSFTPPAGPFGQR